MKRYAVLFLLKWLIKGYSMKRLSIMAIFPLLLLPASSWSTSVPDSGQTRCYDSSEQIVCPQPGADFYGQDAQYGANRQSYTKLDANGNELPDDAAAWAMIRDNITGLIWENKTADGSIHDTGTATNWNNAQIFIISQFNARKFGGYNDWRLPTVKELSSIVDRSIILASPAINTDYFPNTASSSYWSSTTYASIPESAWLVSFRSGGLSYGKKSCSGGQVRAVRSGLCRSSGNYVDNGDGTVTDIVTGLVWQAYTASGTYTWRQALAYGESLQLAGYTDWRLPNIHELQSLAEYGRYDTSIDPAAFPGTLSSYYWSSTTDSRSQANAWFVSFDNGYMESTTKSGSYYVRAVRGGQCASHGDADCDGILNENDSCPYCYNSGQDNSDGDGLGDGCDNCPDLPNAGQEDADADAIGDACDSCPHDHDNDIDSDTICGNVDNCPTAPNEGQLDSYPPQGNGIGDTCDCEGNFNCSIDQDVDGSDAAIFKADFGRNVLMNTCTAISPCDGNFSCDSDVDGSDASLFKQDFGRSQIKNQCPACKVGPWCVYP